MAKRYYKVGEFVWLKELNKKGKVVELHIDDLGATISHIISRDKDGKPNTFKEEFIKFENIDKDRSNDKNKENRSNRKDTILFAKVRENAIIPSKSLEDAGYDIYSNFEQDAFVFQPHETKLVPTGIASSVLDKYALIVKERGSTGSKGMAVRAGVVDSGYRDEIFVAITNENNSPLAIIKDDADVKHKGHDGVVYHPYNKAIAQLLLVSVPDVNVKEISFEDLRAIPSKRGEGKLGSSDK